MFPDTENRVSINFTEILSSCVGLGFRLNYLYSELLERAESHSPGPVLASLFFRHNSVLK